MITIGVNFGGPEQHGSPIYKLLNAAGMAITKERGAWVGTDDFGPCDPRPTSGRYFEAGSAPAVNVIFYVPGSLISYDELKKIEASRFSRKQKLLLVAVPVPKAVAQSGGSVAFVIDALHQANALAAEVFARKGVGEFDLAKAETLVEKVKETLVAQARGTGEAGES